MADNFGESSAVRPFTGQQHPQTAATETTTEEYFDQARPTTSSRSSFPPARPSLSGSRPMTSGRPTTSRPGTAQQGVPEWLFQESRLSASPKISAREPNPGF